MRELERLSAAPDASAFLDAFAGFPQAVRRDPFRVGLATPATARHLVGLALTPLREAWLLRRGGRIVGRVHANASWTREGIGYIGFFEVDLAEADHASIAAELMATAETWLASHGVRHVYGPIDWCTWFSYRFLAREHARPAPEGFRAWEPVNPPEFVDHWEAAGFKVEEHYHSKAIHYGAGAPLEKAEEELRPIAEQLLAAGYTFHPLGSLDDILARTDDFFAVSSAGFGGNFLYEPIPLEVHRAVLAGHASKVDSSISWWAHAPDGTPVGYAFCFVEGASAVGKSIVVVPEHRGRTLGPALFRFVLTKCLPRHVDTWVSALIREGNVSDRVTRSAEGYTGEAWRHEYVLLGKDLAQA